MKDRHKTKEQLINDLALLRVKITELESVEAERKRAEQITKEARKYAASIVDTVRESLVVLDADLKVISANQSFYQTFKVAPKETEGQYIYELGNRQWAIPMLRELLEKILPESTTFNDFEVGHTFETIGRKVMLLNGRQVYQEVTATPLILLAIEDITEHRQMQERLLTAERLATLGQFSVSISHELRNPLGVIDSSVYYLKTKLKDADGKVQEHLDRVKSSVGGSTAIIESLLNLTRMKESQLSRLDLTAITSDAIATSKVPTKVKVTRNFPEQGVPVNGDGGQLRMAFKNIIKNAVEAMDGKGTLTITLGTDADGQAEVSFADNGPGIAQEDLVRVFQPLFSTKAKGIGFGLSIAKMVVDKHGGTIEAESKPRKGATIVVKFPLYVEKTKEA